MKKGFLITLLLFAGQLYAYECSNDTNVFYADFLLWKLREGSADNWAQEISPSGTTNQAVNILSVPFKWSPGLRVGIGRNRGYNGWDTFLTYTNFKTKGKSQAVMGAGGLYSPFLGNFFVNNTNGYGFGPNYHNASINWKLNYNVLDLEFGRTFKVDKFLQLRSFVGIKGGFINQNITSTWQNPTTATTFTSATENLKNDFWGIGPSIGLDTTWPLYAENKHEFSLIGNFSGALMSGHWKFYELYQNNTPTTVAVNINTINGAATMTRAFLGIEWGRQFSGANMRIRLGYEAQIWFNQVQYYSFNGGRLNNLMSLQGGVLSFCVS